MWRRPRGEKPGTSEVESGGGEAGSKLVHFNRLLAFAADVLLCAAGDVEIPGLCMGLEGLTMN
jgi:hypothetical protein